MTLSSRGGRGARYQGAEKASYDALKQLGFYTDCLGEANWSIPAEVINCQIAEALVWLARTWSVSRETTNRREIELWVTHMQGGITRLKPDRVGKVHGCGGLASSGIRRRHDRFHCWTQVVEVNRRSWSRLAAQHGA